jgi:hypothetical protein
MEQTHEGSWRFLETLGCIVVCKNGMRSVKPLVRYSYFNETRDLGSGR